MKLTDQIFREICTYQKNPGEYLDGEKYRDFGWLDTADIYQHLETIYSLVKYAFSNPPKVLELGVSDGTSSLTILKALSEIDGPELTSVDCDVCQHLASRLIDHFELRDKWKYFVRKTDDFFTTNRNTFDVILIDADHTYPGAKRDFDNSIHILNQGGIILIHDAFMHTCSHFDGVSKLVWELMHDDKYNCFVSTIPNSMAFVQRKADMELHYPWK